MNSPLFFSNTRDFLHFYLPGVATQQTVDSYQDALTIFRRYVGDERGLALRSFTFDDCTFEFVLGYRNWLSDDLHLAPATINVRLAALRSYVHYAAKCDISLQQVSINLDNVPFKKNPQAVLPIFETAEALAAFLDAPPNTATGRRDLTLLAVLYDAALRASELTQLRVCDLSLNGDVPHLLIHGKGRKERKVPITDRTKDLLFDFLEEAHGGDAVSTVPVFFSKIHGKISSMTVRNIERIAAKYGREARKKNPDVPENVHPHMLRRTRASLLYRDGTPMEMISILLGHASITTTMSHYAFASLTQKREAMEKGGAGCIAVAKAEPEWPENNDEFARLCGLR